MPRLLPFRGVRYHPLLFPDLGQVVAPPYDLIGSRERQALLERHDRNVVRLVLGFEEAGEPGTPARYADAARTLAEWLAEGTLVRDPRPSLYGYAQRFPNPLDRSGEPRSMLERVGFIGRVGLEPWGHGIHPHERTLAAPKADRLRLLRATRARLDPVFGLMSDPAGELVGAVRLSRRATTSATWIDEAGIEHALWPIAAAKVIDFLVAGMAARDIVIADGHHRYETALAFREECRQSESPADRRAVGRPGAADYVLMFLAALEDPSLVVLPVHRLLIGIDAGDLRGRLEERFQVEAVPGDPEAVANALSQNGVAIGYMAREDAARLVAHPPVGEEHPAAIVDREILGGLLGWKAEEAVCSGRLRFSTDWRETVAAVKNGEASCAFLLPPTPVAAVAEAARAGRTMPQKSTYFYPKIPSGLVFDFIDS